MVGNIAYGRRVQGTHGFVLNAAATLRYYVCNIYNCGLGVTTMNGDIAYSSSATDIKTKTLNHSQKYFRSEHPRDLLLDKIKGP